MTESPVTPDPDANGELDPFDQWLTTGTLRRRKVTFYANQGAADELEAIAAEIEESEREARRRTIDTINPARDIEDRWSAAHEKWEASRVEFSIVRLLEPVREQLSEEFPEPQRPRAPGDGATAKHHEEWKESLREHNAEKAKVSEARDLATLTYSIERLETAKGTSERVLDADGRVKAPAISREQLRTLVNQPYGPHWYAMLVEALNTVSSLAGEPDRPFSPRGSGRGPT
jgi:hypothetical protein